MAYSWPMHKCSSSKYRELPTSLCLTKCYSLLTLSHPPLRGFNVFNFSVSLHYFLFRYFSGIIAAALDTKPRCRKRNFDEEGEPFNFHYICSCVSYRCPFVCGCHLLLVFSRILYVSQLFRLQLLLLFPARFEIYAKYSMSSPHSAQIMSKPAFPATFFAPSRLFVSVSATVALYVSVSGQLLGGCCLLDVSPCTLVNGKQSGLGWGQKWISLDGKGNAERWCHTVLVAFLVFPVLKSNMKHSHFDLLRFFAQEI